MAAKHRIILGTEEARQAQRRIKLRYGIEHLASATFALEFYERVLNAGIKERIEKRLASIEAEMQKEADGCHS